MIWMHNCPNRANTAIKHCYIKLPRPFTGVRIKYYTPLEMAADPGYVEVMSHGHHHHHTHEHRAIAGTPTCSLLRLSVGQRLTGTAVVLAGLWLLVFGVMG